ncbi:MAG: KamA family radical SAM protein [Thermoplasmatota archaeon]
MGPRYLKDIGKVREIPPEERRRLEEVAKKYQFYANEYYLSLIDWTDPEDPIRKIIIPQEGEISNGGTLDPSNEKSFTVAKGMEHKYGPTALILASRACGGVCRFCFRKRIFMPDNVDAVPDLTKAFDYLEKHKEINNVLLSGGDPLVLPTKYLEQMLERLDSMDHIRFLRIGTKMVVYNPFRIIEDPSLTDMVRRFSRSRRKLYIITDINHPRELTKYSIKAINMLQEAGAVLSNQTPLLRGINDDKETLKELFNKLAAVGVPPYYVFQCRPTSGNRPFSVPIEEGYRIFEQAKAELSGLAKRSRFMMSHATGKLEIVGLTDSDIIFKYHNAAHEENDSRVLIFKRNPEAAWLDDYPELVGSFSPDVEYVPSLDGDGGGEMLETMLHQ